MNHSSVQYKNIIVDYEDLKQNTVHVNDLENHWKEALKNENFSQPQSLNHETKADTSQTIQRNSDSNNIFNSNSSIISSFNSSSTALSSSIQSNSNKPIQMCFTSCLKKYRNISLNDTAELSIKNYANLINFIYTHWINRKSL
ncbi:hypothetical protein SSS_10648 [Sarcoptes scabiei]|nr:hypothetical protein SSS_10648 [Sarcoptes scabiei]